MLWRERTGARSSSARRWSGNCAVESAKWGIRLPRRPSDLATLAEGAKARVEAVLEDRLDLRAPPLRARRGPSAHGDDAEYSVGALMCV